MLDNGLPSYHETGAERCFMNWVMCDPQSQPLNAQEPSIIEYETGLKKTLKTQVSCMRAWPRMCVALRMQHRFFSCHLWPHEKFSLASYLMKKRFWFGLQLVLQGRLVYVVKDSYSTTARPQDDPAKQWRRESLPEDRTWNSTHLAIYFS